MTVDLLFGDSSIEEALNLSEYSSQAQALLLMLDGKSLFISGQAGSGKTEVVRRFIEIAEERGKRVGVTATTGIAASLIGGVTIHSLGALGVDPVMSVEKTKNGPMRGRFYNLPDYDVIIIDEISMLSDLMLDKLDYNCRMSIRSGNPKKYLPFGGKQIIMVGDMLQLKVVTTPKDTELYGKQNYAFKAKSWKKLKPIPVFLDRLRRSNDPRLSILLNAVGDNALDKPEIQAILREINSHKEPQKDKVYSKLYTTNISVDKYNLERQRNNPGESMSYPCREKVGDYEVLLKELRIDEYSPTVFKVGDIVMQTVNESGNDTPKNGDIGVVTYVFSDSLLVRFNRCGSRTVAYKTFVNEYKSKNKDGTIKKVKKGSVDIIPLKLSYALTIHKSQGQTFDGVEVDLSTNFQKGLGYVALSRVRDIDSLIVKSPITMSDLEADPAALRFNMSVKKLVKSRKEDLDKAAKEIYRKEVKKFSKK